MAIIVFVKFVKSQETRIDILSYHHVRLVTIGQALSYSNELPPAPLMPFAVTGCEPWAVPFALQDYFELIDWSGRVFHPDKRGVLEENTPPILKRIGIEPAQFIQCAGDFMHVFGLIVGSPDLMAECCARRQVKFLRGIRASREMLGAA